MRQRLVLLIAVVSAALVGSSVAAAVTVGNSSQAARPPGSATAVPTVVGCTSAEKTKRLNALRAYRRKLAAERRAYFRAHHNPRARRAFVKRQPARLRALKRAASCTVTTNPPPPPPTATLSVTIHNHGQSNVAVTSNPAGIDCSRNLGNSTCTYAFPVGTQVTLTETEASGGSSGFEMWEGACSGNSQTCNATMAADTSVTATWDYII
jgi:hypothetical protein